ncbi:MAG: type II secretion system F family protein [FCB group bacterium]|jgi:type IV pilus assembly protein PilC|nr:type II secretion system F family protein [FCB group bacterium]
MAKFAYKAINKEGKEQFGVIDSESQALALNDIRSLGLYPTQVWEARKSDERRARKKKKGLNEFYMGGLKQKQIVIMTRQLATLIDAGLPLLRSLNVLIAQQPPSKLKDILREIAMDVQSGSTFSEALAKHPRGFDRLFVNMVRAGEIGGMLEVVLNRLALFMEKRAALKARVKSAMFYPIFVIIIATVIVLGILTFIVPSFGDIFKDFGAELPGMTKFLISAGNFVKYGWWKGLLILDAIVITFKLLRKVQYFRIACDWLSLKLWLIGDLVTKVSVARFARTLGTLITSGVPILQSLRITKETIGNHFIETAVQSIHDSIKEGDTIAAPLDKAKVFPAMVVNMIDVGEETGSLDSMLIKIADIYDLEVETAIEGLLRLIEPMLIVVLGVIIGFIVIALYMPIFSLADQLSGG